MGPDGQPSGVEAIVQGITGPRRAEERQRAAETTEQKATERVGALMGSLTEGLCVLDPDYWFTYVNAAAEQINGMGWAELLGRTQWKVFPGCVGTVLEREFRRAMDERVMTEFENHYDPWDRWYALKAYPGSDGGICVLYRDITEPKRGGRRPAPGRRVVATGVRRPDRRDDRRAS